MPEKTATPSPPSRNMPSQGQPLVGRLKMPRVDADWA
jgi:hypothetical protein